MSELAPFTPQEDDVLARLYCVEGRGIPVLCAVIGRKPPQVLRRIKELRLERGKKPPEHDRVASEEGALSRGRLAAAGAKLRRCLGCQHRFFSEGIHNRLCPHCKSAEMVGGLDDLPSPRPQSPRRPP